MSLLATVHGAAGVPARCNIASLAWVYLSTSEKDKVNRTEFPPPERVDDPNDEQGPLSGPRPKTITCVAPLPRSLGATTEQPADQTTTITER